MGAHAPEILLAQPLAFNPKELGGLVVVARRRRSGAWDQDFLPLQEVRATFTQRRAANTDHYVSEGVFSEASRLTVHFKRIGASFADLDTYKMGHLKGRPAESLCHLLLDFCYSHNIPEPSIVVFSGRGLQVKWCYTAPVPAAALPRWQAVQARLCSLLATFGADRGALDASRVLRVVGSVNQKSGEVVRVVHCASTPTMGGTRLGHHMVGYDFDEFATTILPYPREVQKHRPPTVARPAECAPRVDQLLRPLSARSLAWDRLHDLMRLAEMRGWTRGAPHGYRNDPVFLGAVFLSHAVLDLQNFDQEVEALARMFAPQWSPREVAQCVTSVKRRLSRAFAGETVMFNGREVDPRYKYTNKRIIELLDITPKEQEGLKTIIGPREKTERGNRRKADWREKARASGKLSPKGEGRRRKRARGADALKLREEGHTWEEVKRRLGFNTADAARKAAKAATAT